MSATNRSFFPQNKPSIFVNVFISQFVFSLPLEIGFAASLRRHDMKMTRLVASEYLCWNNSRSNILYNTLRQIQIAFPFNFQLQNPMTNTGSPKMIPSGSVYPDVSEQSCTVQMWRISLLVSGFQPKWVEECPKMKYENLKRLVSVEFSLA